MATTHKRNRFLPALENLEDRQVPSAPGTVDLRDNILFIQGTETDDRVEVKLTAARTIEIIFQSQQVSFDRSLALPVPPQRIEFHGSSGNDIFTNATYLPSWAFGDSGKDTLTGGTGADRFFGGEGDDSLLGGGGNDTLDGGWGNDTLFGEAGDDLLLGGGGGPYAGASPDRDYLDGGKDRDDLWGDESFESLTGEKYLTDATCWGMPFDSHGVYTPPPPGVLAWNSSDLLLGGDGDDRLHGGVGLDTLLGGAGNDLLDGGQDGQKDVLFGGAGSDTFFCHEPQGGILEDDIWDFNGFLNAREDRDVLAGYTPDRGSLTYKTFSSGPAPQSAASGASGTGTVVLLSSLTGQQLTDQYFSLNGLLQEDLAALPRSPIR